MKFHNKWDLYTLNKKKINPKKKKKKNINKHLLLPS